MDPFTALTVHSVGAGIRNQKADSSEDGCGKVGGEWRDWNTWLEDGMHAGSQLVRTYNVCQKKTRTYGLQNNCLKYKLYLYREKIGLRNHERKKGLSPLLVTVKFTRQVLMKRV